MGKTSSSRKKKGSKIHSEGRKKKKNRATKSKKMRSRKDYSSSCSDDSRSSLSISSSSSEDEHYRSRSRRKSELKGSKKRGRERSSSKRVKVSKIKKPRKKKLKREPSFSSLSSDSHSSTDSVPSDTKKKLRKKRRKREPSIDSIACDFSSDEIREVESRNKRKSKGEKSLGKTESLKVRSRSSSPYDRYYDGNDSYVPIVPAGNSSRRLRSVITVVKPEEEENEWSQDGLKEETMHDRKGHLLSRSNDGTDEDNNGGLDHWSEDKRILKRDESSLSDLKPVFTRGVDSGINSAGNDSQQEEVVPVLPNTETDLESILRLKALENMIKFKGAQIEKLKGPPRVRIPKVEEQSRVPVAIKSELSTIPKRAQNASLVIAENVVNENSAITSKSIRAESTNDERKNNVLKSSILGPSIIPKRTQNADSLRAKSSLDNKTALTTEIAAQASNYGEPNISLKPLTSESINNIPEKIPSAKSPVAKNNLNNEVALTSASMERACDKQDEQDNDVPKTSTISETSSLQPTLEGNSSKERQSTDKDGSQFERKTMTVMRGGEMVEVSYKVCIPKKAPALARRSFRR